MRFLLISLLAVFLFACKKEKDALSAEEDNTPGSIQGTWELKETYSGMSPYMQHPPGNGNILTFTDNSYQIIIGGEVRQEGTYSLSNDSVTNVNTCALEAPVSSTPNRIVFDNEVFLHRGFSVTSKTLTLTTGCIPADGGVSKYRWIDGSQVR